MYQEVNTGPVENLDVLERLIQVGGTGGMRVCPCGLARDAAGGGW